MERDRLKSVIESLLFVSGEPLSLAQIAQVLDLEDKKDLKCVVGELVSDYKDSRHGIRLVEVAGGYQFQTAPENSSYVAKLVKTKPVRLSRPALETLAIIAYQQPITTPEVEKLRGVDSQGVIHTLLELGFIQIMGRKDVPGKPLIYGTTKKFLEFFRLKSLSELPSLEEFMSVGKERALNKEDAEQLSEEEYLPSDGKEAEEEDQKPED